MKIRPLETDVDTLARDSELLSISESPLQGLRINYHRHKDDSYWNIRCNGILSYKVIPKEISGTGYLKNLPTEGAFYEIFGSPWIEELGSEGSRIVKDYNHFVLQFKDDIIELISINLIFEKIKESPANRA